MSTWEGYGVSVRCGALGCYQGTVLAADGDSITLGKPFRNGFPYPKAQVTLKASDIKSLEIISERVEEAPAHSTVLAAGKRRSARASVGESLRAPENIPSAPAAGLAAPPAPAPGSSGGAGAGAAAASGKARAAPARSKPIDIQGSRSTRATNTHQGSYGSTPKGRGGGAGGGSGGGGGGGGDKARRRNEACFGAAALEELQQDFDFEGNLALFDKEALRQQLRPDVVKVAAAREAARGRLRHDQNVLSAAPPDTAPVHVPLELRGPVWYVTDAGVRVPSLSARARRQLWGALLGGRAADAQAALTLLARCVCDVALRLVGGTRRLDLNNAHQRPVAGVSVRDGGAGAAAVTSARLLMSHGVDTYVIHEPETSCGLLRSALTSYVAAGGRTLAPREPRPAADLLLLALHDPAMPELPEHYQSELEWAVSARAALVVLEPGAGGAWSAAGAAARAALCALLPPALPAVPRLLLANVAPPTTLFTDLGLAYRPPFGAAALLPLHAADD